MSIPTHPALPAIAALSLCILTQPVIAAEDETAPPTASAAETIDSIAVERLRADEEAKDTPTRLENLIVTGQQRELPRYVVEDASSATKMGTPIIETPQSLSVIPRERLEDLGALTVQDALRYTAGVRADAYGFDSRDDSAVVRGTDMIQYQDGLRYLFGYFNNTRQDVYALDSIEVLRGPASVLYGQGTSGGMSNVNSKRPKPTAAHEMGLQYGRYDRKQLTLDSTGPLTNSGSVLYRLVALQRESDTQVDYVNDDRWFVAPSLTFLPTDWLSWTVLGHFQQDESGSSTAFLPWEGTVLPNPNGQIPTERFASEPDFDRYDTEQSAVTSLLNIKLGDSWSLQQNLRYLDSNADYATLYPNVYTGDPYLFNPIRRTSVLRIAYASDTSVQALTSDTRLQGRLRWGGIEHLVLAGFDGTRVREHQQEGQLNVLQIVAQGQFNLYEPVYGRYIEPEMAEQPTLTTRQTGFYLQDQIRFGQRLIALLGGRYDNASSRSGSAAEVEDEETSLRAGLLYHFDRGWAPYLNYSESFQPVSGTDAEGNPFTPVRGTQYEAGLKFQPPSANTLITVAVFDITEENRLAPGPDPTSSVQLGEARIRGFEFETTTRWRDRVDLIAQYTYLDAYSDDGPNAADDARIKNLAAVPEHHATLWSMLHFSIAGVPGFSIGAGVRYTSAIPDESNTVEAPSNTLYDAMLSYTSEHWRIAVNGSNLEDETVVATCLERGDCFYAPRMNVVGSITYRF